MEPIEKLLIAAGIGAVVGLLLIAPSEVELGRLPVDILVQRGGFVSLSPFGSSLVLSMLLTVLLNLSERR